MPTRVIGETVQGWVKPARPDGMQLTGRYSALEPLTPAHAAALHAANCADASGAIWDYMPYGPFDDLAAYQTWLNSVEGAHDPVFLAIRNLETGQFCGVASFLRISPEAGSIEVGHICFAPALQRTRAATEAMYLMMRWAFEAGYRRYEWKCNALNLPSRRAAERLGFSYEGVFRQAAIVKGRNRDTAWFAAIDKEWPALRAAYETWLAADNFASDGGQQQRLSDLTAGVLMMRDPGLERGASNGA